MNILIDMNKLLYTPKPNRLLLPTADEWPKNIPDFTTLKSRDPNVIKAIKGGGPGIRVLFDEVRALKTLKEMLQRASTPEEAAEVGTLGAVAMFGGAAYLLRSKRAISGSKATREVQNRYVELKPFAADTLKSQPDTEELRDKSLGHIEDAISCAEKRFKDHRKGESAAMSQKSTLQTGRVIANTAVHFAVIGIGDLIADRANAINHDEAQFMGRDACADAVRIGREMSEETGYNMSLIHLADPLAPGSVEAQRAASDSVFTSFQSSHQEVANWTLAA